MPVARVRGHARARARVMAACLLFGLLAALGGPAGTAAAAAPAGRVALAGTPGFCPDSSGVSVVVDYQGLGGGRIVRCAPGPQADGLAALRNAGFEVGGTTRWGDAFICRINGRPGADSESCVDTPPATAYWSYWHAPNGGAWTYSQRGATYRTPPEGSIEGWSFALTDDEDEMASPPGVAPQRPADNGSGGDGGGSGSPGGGAGGGGAASGGSPSGGSGTPGGSGGSGGSTDGGSGGDASGGSATGGQDGTAAGAPGGEPPQDAPDGDAPDAEDPDAPDAEQEDKDTDADRDGDEAAGEDPAAEETDPAPAPTEAAGWSGQDDAHDPSATAGSGGPSAGTLAAIGLATALAAGAGLTAWRRRLAANAPTGSTTPTSTTDTATDQ